MSELLWILLCLSLLYQISLTTQTLTVTIDREQSLSIHTTGSPTFQKIPQNYNISTGRYIYHIPDGTSIDPENAVVFCDYDISFGRLMEWQMNGVLGVVSVNPSSGKETGIIALYYSGEDRDLLEIPFVSVGRSDFFEMIDTLESVGDNQTFRLYLDSNNLENPWVENVYNPIGWIFQITEFLAAFGLLLYGVHKVYLFVDAGQCEVSIGVFAVSAEIVSIVFSMIYLVDPVNMRGLYSYSVANFLISTPVPFSMLGNFLLIFYWVETLDRKRLSVGKFLGPMLPCFIIISVLLFITEIINASLRGVMDIQLNTMWSSIFTLYYVVVIIFTSVVLFIISCQVCEVLSVTRKKVSKRILMITWILVIIAILGIVQQILSILTAFVYGATATTTVFFIMGIFTLTMNFLKLFIYAPRRQPTVTVSVKHVTE
eukprot:TRINITY_DN2279_c0_g1_i3.p1 TRINITY_DN2279_c0_g1~~TRINITY_DN2279_c0_g1_i3.p1  ORF type:complete len:429 (+),score=75.31 TRINITY_DN2279_c0_g1_i3:1-1287(+)